jgi:rhodanese-related sulfurtransferase
VAISAPELLAQIGAGRAPAILDVRSRKEFAAGHVPGAVHIPFHAIRQHASDIPASPEDPIIVYCGYGPRAWIAGAALRKLGFRNIAYLAGHWHRWKKARLRSEMEAPAAMPRRGL